MKNKFILLLLCVLMVFVSCSTIQKDSIYSTTLSQDNIRNVEHIEINIVRQYRENNQEKIEDIKKDLNALLAEIGRAHV